MYCSNSDNILRQEKEAALKRKGYQIRKSKELGIFRIAVRALDGCRMQRAGNITVYGSNGGGVGIHYKNKLVYHAYTPDNVTDCHIEQGWVDELGGLAERVKEQKIRYQFEVMKQRKEVNDLNRRYG